MSYKFQQRENFDLKHTKNMAINWLATAPIIIYFSAVTQDVSTAHTGYISCWSPETCLKRNRPGLDRSQPAHAETHG